MNGGVLVTVRLKSTRLARKALLPLAGRPLLGHLLDRLRCVEPLIPIVICTSQLSEDDPLALFARTEKVACHRGEPRDVLKRLRDAACSRGWQHVLCVTGDNPLVDPSGLRELWHFHREHDFDFTRCEGLPWGAFGYAVRAEALSRACEMKSTDDTEVWGGYFTQTGVFRCGEYRIADQRHWPELRVTVDTEEDYRLQQEIFTRLYRPGSVFGIDEVIALCRRVPALTAINAGVLQKAAPGIRLREERA